MGRGSSKVVQILNFAIFSSILLGWFANQRALKNTTEYNYKQIDVTGKCAEHAKANCTLKLVEFKFLVPKTFWSWVARTTSMLNARKLTPSTGFAVALIDVAVVIADRLWGRR